LGMPLRCLYGRQDRLVVDVHETMTRIQQDVPTAQVTELPACGHFLMEDDPETVGRLLAEFTAGLD